MVFQDSVEICAVGDISPGDHYFLPGCGVKATFQKNEPEFLFKNIKTLISNSDITFGNLEGVLSNFGLNEKDIESRSFRGDPAMAESLRNAGFSILNIANNHILQHGKRAFRETVAKLKDSGIVPLGLAGDKEYSSEPVFFKTRNIQIGFLGYSIVPENYHPKERLYATGPVEDIIKDISRLSSKVDHVIVSLHHGLEAINKPSPYGILLTHKLIDAGASIIFGHHSHVFQAVEKYKSGIICHSLGNFLFDLLWYSPLTYGAVVKIQLYPTKSDFTIQPFIINNSFQPVQVDDDNGPFSEEHISNLRNTVRYDNFEHDFYKYCCEVVRIERKLIYKKFFFFVRNFHKGNIFLKFQFLVRKLLNLSIKC